jgi:hypothetical protein
MKLKSFSDTACSSLGNYVYALIDTQIDPEDPRRFFYIGRGVGNRCFAHARNELTSTEKRKQSFKSKTILEIRKLTGEDPQVEIVAHNLPPEEIHRLEGILIRLLQPKGCKVEGKHADNFCLRAEDIECLHARVLTAKELTARVLLVNLNGNKKGELPPYPEIKSDAKILAERTLGYWVTRFVPNPETVEYVAGVYRGGIRCVFRVVPDTASGKRFRLWKKKKNKRQQTRIEFYGQRDEEKERLWFGAKIRSDDGNQLLTKFSQFFPCRVV